MTRDKFPENKAYRCGGGYTNNDRQLAFNTKMQERRARSPQKISEAAVRNQVQQSIKQEADGSTPRRLNERQWETVVTRLYGNPGQEPTPPPPARANQQKDAKDGQQLKLKDKKLHQVEVERAVDRLYNPNPKKEAWLLEQRVAILNREMRSCQAKPKISRTSERMASGKPHIVDRVDRVIKERQQKMSELISTVEHEEGGAIKGSPYISPRAKGMTRTYQDLMSWDAERTERLQQQREAKVVDEISCPFHPEIDEYSEYLALQRNSKDGVHDLTAEDRLYGLRVPATQQQIDRARRIHEEDLKHSMVMHHSNMEQSRTMQQQLPGYHY